MEEQATKTQTCSHCGKECKEDTCVEEGDKKFCCSSCCETAKKEPAEGEKKESPNVCKFC